MSFRGRSFLAFCVSVFGPLARRPEERVARFLEEAVELAQALDLPRDTVEKIVERTYSRPKGDKFKELGQTQLTLDLLAEVTTDHSGLYPADLDELANNEVERCLGIPAEEWHRRHRAKSDLGIATPMEERPRGLQPLPEFLVDAESRN